MIINTASAAGIIFGDQDPALVASQDFYLLQQSTTTTTILTTTIILTTKTIITTTTTGGGEQLHRGKAWCDCTHSKSWGETFKFYLDRSAVVGIGGVVNQTTARTTKIFLQRPTIIFLLTQNKINFAKTGVMVQCVCPNFVDTNLIRFSFLICFSLLKRF